MLKIKVNLSELYNEEDQTFVEDSIDLELEHSLLSLSKWEAKYEKPFLGSKEHTSSEIMDYIKFMVLGDPVSDDIMMALSEQNVMDIYDYIGSKQTATWFSEANTQHSTNHEAVTSELIYYWMFSFQIPKECETWHLNRLLTLIRVFNVKNEPPKKMSKREIIAQNRALNAQRKARLHTKG